MLMRVLKKFKQSAKRIVTYDEKHNVIDGGEIERKPLSFYVKKGVGTKLKSDVTSHRQSEDQVVAQCTRYLKNLGWEDKTIYTGGIPLPGGRYATNPAKGVPDKLFFNIKLKRKIWVEFKKTVGGIISPEQQWWHDMLRLCGDEVYVVNSLESLISQLTEDSYRKAG